MTLSQRTISFALILLFMFATLGVAVEQAAEEQTEESRLLAEIQALKERIALLENALAQVRVKLEQVSKPIRHTSNSEIDVDPEKHRLEVERRLTHHEIDVDAEKRRIELEQDLARKQTEQEAEIKKFQLEMEQSVQERELEMRCEIEKARIEKEQAVRERDIKKNLAVETVQIDQTRRVQEADIEKNLMVEKARIAQDREVEKAHIERYTAIELAKINAELEREKRGVEVEKEMRKLKEKLTGIEAEHRKKMATLTRLVVIPLKYVKASEIADVVEPFLSEHATVSVKENILVIRDVEACVKDAEMIVEKLDVPREEGGQEANDESTNPS